MIFASLLLVLLQGTYSFAPIAPAASQRRQCGPVQPSVVLWGASGSGQVSESTRHKDTVAKPAATVRAPKKKAQQPSQVSQNVVLTHAICDFDSLAAAVGLAKLWTLQFPDRPTVVVMPQGAHPSVDNFLALHSILFPIRSLSTLGPDIHKLGIMDASTRDRLGAGVSLLTVAQEVYVFDHHAMKTPDINATEIIMQDVGSTTTIVVEMLKAANVPITDAEATLFAIGIHADTGSLTFDCTTSRDCDALAWVMRRGAKQPVIAEYCHSRLTSEQQQFLTESLVRLNTTTHKGYVVGKVVVDCGEYVGGLARVAQHVLELSSCDVLVWGGRYLQGSGARQNKRLVVIGRARSGANFIDFPELFKPLGGGGHMKAAAANVKMSDEEVGTEDSILSNLVEQIKSQISGTTDAKTAVDIMSSPVLTCYRGTRMQDVALMFRKYGIHALPVVGKGDDERDIVLGIVTDVEVLKAIKAGKLTSPVSGWLLKKVVQVSEDTPINEVRAVMVENDGRDVLVMSRDNRLVGLITRTDVLKQFQLYSNAAFPVREAFCTKDWAEAEEGDTTGCTVCSGTENPCPDFRKPTAL